MTHIVLEALILVGVIVAYPQTYPTLQAGVRLA